MKRAFLIVMSAMLAGCSVFSGPPQDDATTPGVTAGTGEGPDYAVQEEGSDAVEGPDQNTQWPKSVPLPKKKPSSIAAIRPNALVGLTPNEVEALIGRPVSKADRPPARVWYYRTNHCALEVFFYMDVGTKTFRALTFNMKRPNGEAAEPSLCLRQIRAVSYGS